MWIALLAVSRHHSSRQHEGAVQELVSDCLNSSQQLPVYTKLKGYFHSHDPLSYIFTVPSTIMRAYPTYSSHR
jgi:hypothetical protein